MTPSRQVLLRSQDALLGPQSVHLEPKAGDSVSERLGRGSATPFNYGVDGRDLVRVTMASAETL